MIQLKPAGVERSRKEMSRLTTIERVEEIAQQMPKKRLGHKRYCSRQYNNLEETIRICRNLHQENKELKAALRLLNQQQSQTS